MEFEVVGAGGRQDAFKQVAATKKCLYIQDGDGGFVSSRLELSGNGEATTSADHTITAAIILAIRQSISSPRQPQCLPVFVVRLLAALHVCRILEEYPRSFPTALTLSTDAAELHDVWRTAVRLPRVSLHESSLFGGKPHSCIGTLASHILANDRE